MTRINNTAKISHPTDIKVYLLPLDTNRSTIGTNQLGTPCDARTVQIKPLSTLLRQMRGHIIYRSVIPLPCNHKGFIFSNRKIHFFLKVQTRPHLMYASNVSDHVGIFAELFSACITVRVAFIASYDLEKNAN